MRREWKTEWIKVRHRKIGLLVLAFLALTFFWANWGLSDALQSQIQDGYRMCFLQFSIIDTVLLPTMTAMLASRLCDAEVKGGTLKLLCTMERKSRLFDMKLLMGAVYLGAFVGGQLLMILAIGKIYGFGRPMEPRHVVYYVAEVFVVSLAVLLLQQVLSFFYENQIVPLAVGLFGSFVGLFAWFFPGNPLRLLFLWGYYSLLCFINMDWDEAARIVTYYDVPFETGYFILLLAVFTVGFAVGRCLFLRKEI